MKKFIINGLLAAVALIACATPASAQFNNVVPADSAVRKGTLDNGLTYYIRHNETPKGQADFFIAQKVGSVLENEQQRGLAHFLEHMCFNGTQNFPGNSLIDWLETVGVKFGQNLNAYTAFDETVYNISSVPVTRAGVQDSCLLVLHDWADGLLLDGDEIEKERGVIHQEWRRTNVGQMRILEQLLPKIFPGSKYGERLPIGTMEVVDNFPHQVLRDYYEEWYRPDQQGIIVVGDIDPDYIEGKIKEIFSPIQMPANPTPREQVAVPDTPGTIYAIGSDKEMNAPVVMLMFKQTEKLIPDELKNTEAYYLISFIKNMVTAMLNNRLDEKAKSQEATFADGSVDIGDYFIAPTKDALMVQIVAKGNTATPALKDVYAEVLRAARHGFTVGEYERAKAQYLANMERMYNQRNARENTSYAREYAAEFTKGEPAPGIAYEYEMTKQLASLIPVQAINQILPKLIESPDNRVVMGMFPENETFVIPAEKDLEQAMTDAEAMELEAYKDAMKETPLIPQLPAAVSPASTTVDEATGATVLKYPNGLTVVVKPTDFKDGEIIMEGIAKGGFSTVPDEQAASILFMPYAMTSHGLGDYNNLDLQKYMQGKQSSLELEADSYTTSLSGTTTPADLKTLMELIYMNFTDIEITPEEFASSQSRFAGILANQEKNPQYLFGKELMASLFAAPAKQALSTDDITKANREETLDIIHDMMAHPSRFTLAFVGDIDMETFVPMADQYLGSIRANRSMPAPYVENPAFEFAQGQATTHKTAVMETPQTFVAVTASAAMPYTAKARQEASMAGQILSNRLLKKIREEMGAVYSIGAAMNMSRVGNQNVIMQIPFPMDPARRDEVLTEINNILTAMTTDVTAEELDPIKEFMVKDAKEKASKNQDWAGFLAAQSLNGTDTFTHAVEDIQSVTPADISAFVKALLDAGNLRVLTLDPAE